MSIADKSGRGVLLEALNKAVRPSGFEFADGELTFGAVAPSTNQEREAEVPYSVTNPEGLSKTINGVASKIVTGAGAVAFIDRLDIGQVFLNAGIEVPTVPTGEYVTTGDIVAALNLRYSVGFTAEDIDFTVPVTEQSVVLTALPGSYGFRGDLMVDITPAGEPEVPLTDVVVNPVLDGPDYGDVTPIDPDAQPQ